MDQLFRHIQSISPLQLPPDRPASVHRVSYESVKYEQSLSHFSSNRQAELISVINRNEGILLNSRLQSETQRQTLLKHMLLFHIQIHRLRVILSEMDAENRQIRENSMTLENTYRLRLEELKMGMTQYFEQEIDRHRAEGITALEQIESAYNSKLASQAAAFRTKEEYINSRQRQFDSQSTKMKIYEMERTRLENTDSLHKKEISRLEGQIQVMKRRLGEQSQRREAAAQQLSRWREVHNEKETELLHRCSQYEQQVTKLGNSNHQYYLRLEKAQQSLKDKDEQIEKLGYTLKSMERELSQFKNRKTQTVIREEINSHGQNRELALQLEEIRNELKAVREQREMCEVKAIEEERKAKAKIREMSEEFIGNMRKHGEKISIMANQLEKMEEEWRNSQRKIKELLKSVPEMYIKNIEQLQKDREQLQKELKGEQEGKNKLKIALDQKTNEAEMLILQIEETAKKAAGQSKKK